MRWNRVRSCALVGCFALAAAALADDSAPADGPGWTGITQPREVIAVRQALMIEIERLMRPLDSFTAGQPAELADLRSAATTIAPMLLVTPHLFPPTTNLYDPAAEEPATLAMPAIWQNFAAFAALATASAAAATTAAEKTDAEELRAAARTLRATCDACHAPYLRPYVAAEVSKEDLDFDFDSVLPPQ